MTKVLAFILYKRLKISQLTQFNDLARLENWFLVGFQRVQRVWRLFHFKVKFIGYDMGLLTVGDIQSATDELSCDNTWVDCKETISYGLFY